MRSLLKLHRRNQSSISDSPSDEEGANIHLKIHISRKSNQKYGQGIIGATLDTQQRPTVPPKILVQKPPLQYVVPPTETPSATLDYPGPKPSALKFSGTCPVLKTPPGSVSGSPKRLFTPIRNLFISSQHQRDCKPPLAHEKKIDFDDFLIGHKKLRKSQDSYLGLGDAVSNSSAASLLASIPDPDNDTCSITPQQSQEFSHSNSLMLKQCVQRERQKWNSPPRTMNLDISLPFSLALGPHSILSSTLPFSNLPHTPRYYKHPAHRKVNFYNASIHPTTPHFATREEESEESDLSEYSSRFLFVETRRGGKNSSIKYYKTRTAAKFGTPSLGSVASHVEEAYISDYDYDNNGYDDYSMDDGENDVQYNTVFDESYGLLKSKDIGISPTTMLQPSSIVDSGIASTGISLDIAHIVGKEDVSASSKVTKRKSCLPNILLPSGQFQYNQDYKKPQALKQGLNVETIDRTLENSRQPSTPSQHFRSPEPVGPLVYSDKMLVSRGNNKDSCQKMHDWTEYSPQNVHKGETKKHITLKRKSVDSGDLDILDSYLNLSLPPSPIAATLPEKEFQTTSNQCDTLETTLSLPQLLPAAQCSIPIDNKASLAENVPTLSCHTDCTELETCSVKSHDRDSIGDMMKTLAKLHENLSLEFPHTSRPLDHGRLGGPHEHPTRPGAYSLHDKASKVSLVTSKDINLTEYSEDCLSNYSKLSDLEMDSAIDEANLLEEDEDLNGNLYSPLPHRLTTGHYFMSRKIPSVRSSPDSKQIRKLKKTLTIYRSMPKPNSGLHSTLDIGSNPSLLSIKSFSSVAEEEGNEDPAPPKGHVYKNSIHGCRN